MNLLTIVAHYDENSEVITTGTLRQLFPNVSFPRTGPNQQWLTDNSVYEITSKSYTELQKSTEVELYYEDGAVYNNVITDKTQTDFDDDVVAILAADKSSKIQMIVYEYLSRIADGFVYAGYTYQIDDIAQANMVATQARFNNGVENSHGGYWRDKDNVKRLMNDHEVQELFDAAFEYKSGLIRQLHDFKDLVSSATTSEEVALIDETTGWPSNEMI